MPPPPGFEEIQRQELSRTFERLVGLRLLALPVAAALALFVAVAEPSRWRTVFLLALLLTLGTFFVAEALRVRRRPLHGSAVTWNLLVAVLGQLGVAFATGGLGSPFTYTFVPLALVIGVFGSERTHLPLVSLQIAGVAALTWVEASRSVPDLELAVFGGATAHHARAYLFTSAAVLVVVLAVAARGGRGVRRVFDGMLQRALGAQHESLRAHTDRAEELTALSAEIAHELKNPLASVKGLAALLAESAPPGKAAERLSVLRREVDRMQGILEEFLNFSRPLVPLAVGRVDLRALAREVALLHEGMAHQRGIAIQVGGEAAEARCDRRKIKQVLINLVQNALDATPERGEVLIEVEPARDSDACVRVLDRGRGVEAALAGRIFDPGVTTKPSGSGLGLTIARALARQHGGEVELEARGDGGCAAVLRLPGAPPAAVATEAAP